SRRNVFEPRLVRGDLYGLTGPRRTALLKDALPALPREFVIVPDADERPASARVLQIWIGEVALIHRTVAFDRLRPVEIAGLTCIGDLADIIDRAIEAFVSLFGVLNNLINEVAQVQYEANLILRPSAFILEDHPAVPVELSFVHALAAYE